MVQIAVMESIGGDLGEYLMADIRSTGQAGADEAELVVLGEVWVAHW
jgi:hypothetical protein